MNSKALSCYLAAGAGLALASGLLAQTPQVQFPAPSPGCTLKQRVGLTDIEVVYSRPGVKGRAIFGGIVPYGEVWRTGANASTKVSFSTPVKLDGHAVPAGTYALFTIPGAEEWTIILSKDTKIFGAFGYSEANDLLRFKTKPIAFAQKVESFTIDINDIRDESAVMVLLWDQTLVPVRIEVDVNSTVLPAIEAAMASPEKKSAQFYFQAASYYFDHDQDLKKALGWLDSGLQGKPQIAFELLFLKAKILAKQGDKDGAIAAAKESNELAIKAEGPNNSIVKMNNDLISSLQ
jgi:hypothetical protein